jgi:hypothetical protein
MHAKKDYRPLICHIPDGTGEGKSWKSRALQLGPCGPGERPGIVQRLALGAGSAGSFDADPPKNQ